MDYLRNILSGIAIAFGVGVGLSQVGVVALLGWAIAIIAFLTLRRTP